MERARIGIYLGRYPKHSRNVTLVLNIKTGRVSPQFHFKMDPMFHTVKNATRQERVQSKWQEAAGFIIGTRKGGETPKGGKWIERTPSGLYLGRSPKHSQNFALVLNIKTGRVSPQFHFKMDPMFHTVKNATRQERVQSK